MTNYVSRWGWRPFQVIDHLSFWCLPSSNLQCYWKVGDLVGWRLRYYLRVLWKFCDDSSMRFSKVYARVQSPSYDGIAIFHSFLPSIGQTRSSLDLLWMNISIREVFAWLGEVLFLSMDEIKRSVVDPNDFSLLCSFILLWLLDHFLDDAQFLLLLAHPLKQVLIFQRFSGPV